MDVIDAALWALVRAMNLRCTVIFEEGTPYLARFYLGHKTPAADLSVYLHYFFSSDDPDFLHNHPWRESHSVILTGGYREEYFIENDGTQSPPRGSVVQEAVHRPKDWVRITQDRFHRVELLEDRCWTLFISGARTDTWRYWERKTNRFEVWTARNERMSHETFIWTGRARDPKLKEMLKATER